MFLQRLRAGFVTGPGPFGIPRSPSSSRFALHAFTDVAVGVAWWLSSHIIACKAGAASKEAQKEASLWTATQHL